MLEMAKRDPSREVRGQSLFWLAQKAGEQAATAIENAIRDDPETEVKEKAVFALTQLPHDEGVPQLIRLAELIGTPRCAGRRCSGWVSRRTPGPSPSSRRH